ncbi:MAG: hypothetical protein ACI8QS_002528 [Planctomycetota bacterium]|jgi:hypothetical protein
MSMEKSVALRRLARVKSTPFNAINCCFRSVAFESVIHKWYRAPPAQRSWPLGKRPAAGELQCGHDKSTGHCVRRLHKLEYKSLHIGALAASLESGDSVRCQQGRGSKR